MIAEQNSLGITRYIRSSELIARNTDAARTYYHYVSDEIGSTTHIVDEDGIVLNHYTYDAWGNLTAQEEAVPNRFKFTGQQLDPVTQQYYLRARFYNPVIARFTQEDTYRGDGLNLYAYCQNNPVFYADPSGNIASCLKEAYHTKLEQLSKEYVTDNMSAEEKTAALQQAKKDAYQAAKETYKKNHVDKNPRPDVSVPSDRSTTRAEWDRAYRDIRVKTNSQEQIKIAQQNQQKASKVSAQYGYDKKPGKKTVASDGSTYTLSGWADLGEDSIFTRVDPLYVKNRANEIEYQLKRAGANDQGVTGKYNASHAEKQLSIISDQPIGVSEKMCKDCRNYFQALASRGRKQYVVADPNYIRIFNPDGTIIIIPQ